jgi:hypothetical protein
MKVWQDMRPDADKDSSSNNRFPSAATGDRRDRSSGSTRAVAGGSRVQANSNQRQATAAVRIFMFMVRQVGC